MLIVGFICLFDSYTQGWTNKIDPGNPQGSIISPLVFSNMVNDVFSVHQDNMQLLFSDCCHRQQINAVRKQMCCGAYSPLWLFPYVKVDPEAYKETQK